MDATDRINTALLKLKNELVSLRSQDVKLMKQLITINETIQKMTKKSPVMQRRLNKSSCNVITNPRSQETPLVRQRSLPNYCHVPKYNYSGSLSSIEDTDSSSEDLSSGSEGEETPVSPLMRATSFNRPRSMALQKRQSAGEDSCYEDILRRNIKLWKYSKSISNESLNSVFTEDESVILEVAVER